jgi:hypothetical protein
LALATWAVKLQAIAVLETLNPYVWKLLMTGRRPNMQFDWRAAANQATASENPDLILKIARFTFCFGLFSPPLRPHKIVFKRLRVPMRTILLTLAPCIHKPESEIALR